MSKKQRLQSRTDYVIFARNNEREVLVYEGKGRAAKDRKIDAVEMFKHLYPLHTLLLLKRTTIPAIGVNYEVIAQKNNNHLYRKEA